MKNLTRAFLADDDNVARGKRATVNDQGDGAVLVDDDESTCKTFHAQRHTWKVDLGEVFETKTITISLPESGLYLPLVSFVLNIGSEM